MTSNLAHATANDSMAAHSGETPSKCLVRFVRALAIRQARLDAAQVCNADNDKGRRTLH